MEQQLILMKILLKHYNDGADYIGLGPLRFTNTKQGLSPIIGLEGYKDIINKCRANNIDIPIYAIGGIKLEDIVGLNSVGVYGLAISSLILESEEASKTIKRNQFNQFNKNKYNYICKKLKNSR